MYTNAAQGEPLSFTKQNRENKFSPEMKYIHRFKSRLSSGNMKKTKAKTLKEYLLFSLVFSFCINYGIAQGNLQVTIQDGTSTTTCGDIFGGPEPRFSVRINGNNWVTYPATTFCFTDLPNMQYEAFYDCPSDVPATVSVCLRVFEDDGSFCNLNEDCLVEECQNFAVPAPGNSINYTMEIADGQPSDGSIDLTISLDNGFDAATNDLVCDAIELGLLPNTGQIGDASVNYNNYCATSTGDINPADFGGIHNDVGVWFTFTTGPDPSAHNYINVLADPQNLGDDFPIQLALFESLDGTCNNLSFVVSDHDNNDLNQVLNAHCLQANTRYYILVDASFHPNHGFYGNYGIEVFSVGAVEAADFKCDAENLGQVPENGSVGTPMNQSNYCSTDIGEPDPAAFLLQNAVWYMFQAPESGHVIIEAISSLAPPLGVDPVDLQIAAYSSLSGTCNGFFLQEGSIYTMGSNDETLELTCLTPGENYWALIDGSGFNAVGIFAITVSDGGPVPPQSTITMNEVLCNGESIEVGDSIYTQTGPIEEIVLGSDGCNVLITGTLTVLDPVNTIIDTIICSGESVSVGNSIYTESGNYTDIFTSFQNCDSTVITNLTVLENVEGVAVQIQEASDINASDGAATVNVTGGTGPYTYLWSNGATTQTINNLSPGLYCITVTAANGCDDVSCISVLYPGAISVNVEDGQVTCNGDTDGILTITISQGTPAYTYEWGTDFGAAIGSGTIANAGGSAQITNLIPGDNYTITITDNDGLIVVTSGEILEPAPIINNLDTTICFGESLMVGSVEYNASGAISEVLQNADGCDSLVTGTLVVLDEIGTTLDLTECAGTVVMVGNTEYSSTGPISEVLTAANGCDSTVTGFLTILDEISTPIDTSVCFGESIIIGNSVYSSSGVFQDILMAVNGCDSIINTSLTVFDELTVSAQLVSQASGFGDMDGTGQAIANGGSGNNYVFNWSDSQSGNVASGLTGGQTYCVTVTDEIGCTAEDCLVVLFPVDIQSALVNDTLDCPGNTDGIISFSAFNGQAPYTYTWQNADNSLNGSGTIGQENGTETINNLPAGIYTITISDQWGSGSFTIEVVEPTPIFINLQNQLNTSCFGDCDGLLEVQVLGGAAPYTYQWSGGAGNTETASALCAGDYSLTLTDANGCTEVWNGAVVAPDEFIIEIVEINQVSCNGGSDGALGFTSNGNPLGAVWNTGQTDDEIFDLVANSYSVTVTNNDNCTAEASFILQEPLTGISSVISIDQPISCEGEMDGAISIVASGSSGFTFSWSNGQAGAELESLGAGLYEVSIQDENGCEAFDQIQLVEPEPLDAFFTIIDVNCANGDNSGAILTDTVIGGAGAYVYALNGQIFSTISEFNNLPSDNYEVFVQDANGCIASFPLQVTAPGEIEVDLGGDYTILLGETATLEAQTTSLNPVFQWSTDSCSTCTEIFINPIEPTMYSVTVTDTLSGCTATDEIFIRIEKDRDVFIPNVFSPNGDGINDLFVIQSGQSVAMIRNFRVFDRWGAIVFEAEEILPGTEIGWDGTLKGKDSPEGVYVYIAEITFVDGLERLYRGDVTVVR